jgi:hypothetical protein
MYRYLLFWFTFNWTWSLTAEGTQLDWCQAPSFQNAAIGSLAAGHRSSSDFRFATSNGHRPLAPVRKVLSAAHRCILHGTQNMEQATQSEILSVGLFCCSTSASQGEQKALFAPCPPSSFEAERWARFRLPPSLCELWRTQSLFELRRRFANPTVLLEGR